MSKHTEKIEFSKFFRFDEDAGFFRWRANGRPAGSIRRGRELVIKTRGQFFSARVEAWRYHHGTEPPGRLESADGNPWNLRKENVVPVRKPTMPKPKRARPTPRTACLDCGATLLPGQVRRCAACESEHRQCRKFGVTREWRRATLAAQGYKCAICGETPDGGPHVDHDHTDGTVRGLLCRSCNAGLGMFHDDPEVLEAAIVYLKSYTGTAKMV